MKIEHRIISGLIIKFSQEKLKTEQAGENHLEEHHC